MSSSWKALPSQQIKARKGEVDPYLRIADAIGFVDHGPLGGARFAVSVEVDDGAYRPIHSEFKDRGAHPGSRYFTATATTSACNELAKDPKIVRMQFAAALVPQRPGLPFQSSDQRKALSAHKSQRADRAKSTVLLAIIDSGCPFAHLDLRGKTKGSTRVVRLWDQGSGADFGGLGTPPREFGYGLELTRSDLQALIAQSRTPAGGLVDEAACYRRAGYGPAMSRASHGAHSLGMLAAARRWDARPSSTNPLRPEDDKSKVSRTADIIFVQFPHNVMDCVSVAALENRAIDGFRYILRRGKELRYRRIVVSFGYESWIGPHDGSTWFAEAVQTLVREANESLDFQIYTIAGNAKDRRVRVAAEPGKKNLDFGLNVQPGNEAPTFVEIWVPTDLSDHLTFELTPPHEQQPLKGLPWGSEKAWPDASSAHACVVMNKSQVLGRHGYVIVLRIAPTHVTGDKQSAAPHGVWRICLSAEEKVLDGVRAYVGRSEETLGASKRARQSTITGRSELQEKFDRKGTVNGHAPGSGMNVSGAYFGELFPYARTIDRSQKPQGLIYKATPYSGIGPLKSRKRTPDDSITTEDGFYNPGLLGMGNYSGVLFRMTGTSVAAPLRARMQADEPLTGPHGEAHAARAHVPTKNGATHAAKEKVSKKNGAKHTTKPGMGSLLGPF